MSIMLAELQTMLDTVVRAIGSMTLRARGTDGREVQYRSMDEALKAKAVLEEEIRKASNQPGTRTGLAQHKRGDGPTGPSSFYWERW